jgi:hypothetical protein
MYSAYSLTFPLPDLRGCVPCVANQGRYSVKNFRPFCLHAVFDVLGRSSKPIVVLPRILSRSVVGERLNSDILGFRITNTADTS